MTYTRDAIRAKKGRLEKRKKETNQPTQISNILGKAIESVHKQPNKSDIHICNTTNPSKKGADNSEFQS